MTLLATVGGIGHTNNDYLGWMESIAIKLGLTLEYLFSLEDGFELFSPINENTVGYEDGALIRRELV